MKKILIFLTVFMCSFSKEVFVEYSGKSYIIEEYYKIAAIKLNTNPIVNACKYDVNGVTVYFNEEEYRNYYSKLETSNKSCDEKKLDLKNRMGGYILKFGNVNIYDKKSKEYISNLVYEIYESKSIREENEKVSGYEYGRLLNGEKVLFEATWKHDNYRADYIKSINYEKLTDEEKVYWKKLMDTMKLAKLTPKKKIKFEYEDSRTPEKIFRNHVFDTREYPNLDFYD